RVPAPARACAGRAAQREREAAKCALVVMRCQCELLEIVDALRTPCGFTSAAPCRQEQAYEEANQGDHHECLDEREAVRRTVSLIHLSPLRDGSRRNWPVRVRKDRDSTSRPRRGCPAPTKSGN